MKIGVSLSAFPAHDGMPVLFSSNLKYSIPQIKQQGFDGVDLFIRHPDEEESIQAKQLLHQHGLGVGVVMPAALAQEGLSLGHSCNEIRQETIRRMLPMIEYASELEGMLSLGLVRGSVAGSETIKEYLARFADSCSTLLSHAGKHNVPLLIEPINRYEINTLNSSMQALDFVESSGLDLYLMLDTFHMNIEDTSFDASFSSCSHRTKHIHFLDSNRLAPGMGHLDMSLILDTVQRTGYDDYLCMEALPLPDTTTCVRKGVKFFSDAGLMQKSCL